MKKPIHIGSGTLAKFAIYAGTQDKFWQMSDLLFGIARQMHQIDAKFLADKTGLNADELSRAVNNPAIHSRLKKDILDGLKMGVRKPQIRLKSKAQADPPSLKKLWRDR
ncbi:MAG: DsbA family protein [Planctomycetota bacterium]